MNRVLDSGSPARAIATSTATTRTANNARTPNTTTRQPTSRHTWITAKPPNMANTNSSSSSPTASETWVATWDFSADSPDENLDEPQAYTSPPAKAATKPLACNSSPAPKHANANATVANCAHVSLIHPCPRDRTMTAVPTAPITTPSATETNSVRNANQAQRAGSGCRCSEATANGARLHAR